MRKREPVIYPPEVVRNSPHEHTPLWYVMRIAAPKSYPKVLKALDDEKVEYFFPMEKTVRQDADNKRVKVDTPLLGCYIFCRASELTLIGIVNTPSLPLIFYYPRINNTNCRVTVGTEEMQSFMSFAGAGYLKPHYITLEQASQETAGGKRVRFTDGLFKGIEATVSTRKTRRRRVILTLANSIALSVEIGDNEVERVAGR